MKFQNNHEAQFWAQIIVAAAGGPKSISVSIEMADIAVMEMRERIPVIEVPKPDGPEIHGVATVAM